MWVYATQKTTLTWIQDTLRQAALRRGKRRDAHLFRIRIAASSGTNESAPISSLDAYPQAVNTRHKKRQRLIDRHVAALQWIELTAESVRNDRVAACFDTTISNRLNLVGMPTIGCLIAKIAERGYRWWVGVAVDD